MSSYSYAPSKIFDSIIYAFVSGVAYTLHSISSKCTATRSFVALTHVDRIGCMAEVKASGEFAALQCADLMAWRRRKTQTGGSHGVGNSLKGHSGMPVCESNEGRHCAAQGVTSHPDLSVRVESSDVVVEILSSIVVHVLFPQCFHETG